MQGTIGAGRGSVNRSSDNRYLLYSFPERAYDSRGMKASTARSVSLDGDTPMLRLVALLERVASKDQLYSLQALVDDTGLPKPTLHRMLQQLESAGMLQRFRPEEVRAVMAHEIGHVANGDMVTLTLIQGVVNTFVMFLARIIGHTVDRVMLSVMQVAKHFLLATWNLQMTWWSLRQ